MRKAFSRQRRLDGGSVLDVALNCNCRDEMIPILTALQHIYSQPQLRDEILELVANDVRGEASDERGREGLDYWQIVVLAAVRLGCNFDYDRLQDLAENHRALRGIMGVGDFDETAFSWRRIRDNVCRIRPETIKAISDRIVAEGHRLNPEGVERVRADSFVVETNIHWPSESSLIRDGLTKLLQTCGPIAIARGVPGWRQHGHLLKQIRQLCREIDRIASRKGPNYQARIKARYQRLLKLSGKILRRVRELETLLQTSASVEETCELSQIQAFCEATQKVCGLARRRVIEGEKVPNHEKVFSLFEPHTQLYKRGKAGQPVQFGRLVLVYEDAAGFIIHHHLLPRDAGDRDVVVEQTRIVQQRLGGQIQSLSLDRGFHSPENQVALSELVSELCLPKLGQKQAAAQDEAAPVTFHASRQRHPGVESAIGALQSGNGLERCRDRGEIGFERYLALGILGRNLQLLGRMLIATEDPDCEAAQSRRAA